MITLMLALLLGSIHSSAADRRVLTYAVIAENVDGTLESIMDQLTVSYLRDLIDDEKNGFEPVVVTTDGAYRINSYLIVDLSRMPEELSHRVLTSLKQIYVDGEPWRNQRYAFGSGGLGVTSRAKLLPSSTALWARRPVGPSQLDTVCERWLTKVE